MCFEIDSSISMLITFPNFISMSFISKFSFSEIYQYAFISMVILVNVISMKIFSIFSYFEKISVSGSITFQVFISFVCDFYFFTRLSLCIVRLKLNFMNVILLGRFSIRVIKRHGYRVISTNSFWKLKTCFLLCVK